MKKGNLTWAQGAGFFATAGLTLLSVACGSVGSEGKLRLRDNSENHDMSLRAIAAGRSVDYSVLRGNLVGSAVELTEVNSSKEDVFTAEIREKSRVRVHGVAPGKAQLYLTAGDTEDNFELEVRAEAGAMFRAESGTTSFGRFRESSGLRVPFDANFMIRHHHFVDAESRSLSGTGGTIAWTSASGSDVTLTPDSSGYSIGVTSNATAGTASLTSPWSATPLRVTSSELPDVDSFRPYTATTLGNVSVDGKVITFGAGTLATVTFDVLDAAGFMHVGGWDFNGTVEVGDAGLGRVVIENADCGTEAETGCSEFTGVDIFRLTILGGDSAASVPVKLSVGGVEDTYTFRFLASE